MDLLFAALTSVCAVGVLAGLIGLGKRDAARDARAILEHVAVRRGGQVTDGLALELHVDGSPARLTSGVWDDGGWTRFELECALPGQLHVRPPRVGLSRLLTSLFGADELRVGDPRFDGRWAVQGRPEEWVRSALGRIAAFDLHGEAVLDVTPTGIRIEIPENYLGWTPGSRPDRFALTRFLDRAITLARAIRGPVDPAARRIVVKQLLADGRCPVCTDAIGADPERCPRCDTAHHRDCFEFLGGCAVFACDARRARAQAREPAKGW